MEALMPASRIHDVKVTLSPDAPDHQLVNRVAVLEWIDAAGAQQRQDFYGYSAEQIKIDLHAATILGEHARHSYLIGFIRALHLDRRI